MFVRCLDAKSYINTNQVFGLFVEGNTANVADPLYYIKAGMDAKCTVNYLLEGFATKAEAEAALEAIVAKLNDTEEPVPTPPLPPEITAIIADKATRVAARAAARDVESSKQKPTSNSASQLLACNLEYWVDEFARSGDTDYLLRINAHIRSYLEQEAKNE